jgi:hypothetical protein
MLSGTNCLDWSIEAMTVPLLVMPGLVPGIHVFKTSQKQRRGWPGIGERKRRRPLDGYARP